MKKAKFRFPVIVISALAVGFFMVSQAAAETMEIKGKWSLTLSGGIASEISGDVHDGGNGTVLGLPTSVNAKSFNDIYKMAPHFQAALGYGVTNGGEILAIFSYSKMGAEEIQVGDVAGLPLLAFFDDYQEMVLKVGFRQYFAMDSMIAPYATVSGGVKIIETINSTLRVPAVAVVLEDVNFYDKSTVLTFGGGLGVLFGFSPNFGIGIETGIYYQGKPGQIEGLAGTGLENLNDVGNRWSLPLLANLTVKF